MSCFCYECKCITNMIKPVFIRRLPTNSFHIVGLCEVCNNEKGRYINIRIDDIFYKLSLKKAYINTIPYGDKKVDILEKLRGLQLK